MDGIGGATPDDVRFESPGTWREALELKAQHPDALPICGGTDVMVDINFARSRPGTMLDLTRVSELAEWRQTDGSIELGAGVTYTTIERELSAALPSLAKAARTVGSPQIRNRGTVGGNLGTASPAGDAHPALLATGATVEVESVRGRRRVNIDDYFVGPKRSVLQPDELIRAVRVPVADGPQEFAKIGTRNAMVIATVAFALAINVGGRRAGTGIGSAGPVPLRAAAAEDFLNSALAEMWSAPAPLDATTVSHFGNLVASAASPIDDVRGTAAYRRHALSVLARRSLGWAWDAFIAEVAA